MKHLFIPLLLILSFSVFAQNGRHGEKVTDQNITIPNTTYGIGNQRTAGLKGVFYPAGCGRPDTTYDIPNNLQKFAALYYDTCAHLKYTYDPSLGWRVDSSSGGGTTYIPGSGIAISGNKILADNTVARNPNTYITGAFARRRSDNTTEDYLAGLADLWANNNVIPGNGSKLVINPDINTWSDSATSLYGYAGKNGLGGRDANGKTYSLSANGSQPPCYDSTWRSTHSGATIGVTISNCADGTPYYWNGVTWVKVGTGGSSASVYIVPDTINADGTKNTIALYVGSNAVISVKTTSENGGGFTNSNVIGDTLYINYSIAPYGTIYYQIAITAPNVIALGFKPQIGVLFSRGSAAANIVGLQAVGVKYARTSLAPGSAVNYGNYTSAGYKINLTYNFAPPVFGTPVDYATDTAAYAHSLDSALVVNGDSNFAVGSTVNEPGNIAVKGTNTGGYWYGYASQYINLAKSANRVYHKHNIQTTDGGFTGENFYYKVYEDYLNRGYTDSANDFASRAFNNPSGISTWRSQTVRGAQIRFYDTLINAMATDTALHFDYADVHYYEPNLDVDTTNADFNPLTFKQIVSYLRRATGLDVVCTEIGQHNVSPQIVTTFLMAVVTNKIKKAFWYSGNPSYSLLNSDATLRTNGTSFKNYISSL